MTESGFVAVVFSAIFASFVLGSCVSEVLLKPIYWRKRYYQLRGDYAILFAKSKLQAESNDERPLADNIVGPDHHTTIRVNLGGAGVRNVTPSLALERFVFDEPSDKWPVPPKLAGD